MELQQDSLGFLSGPRIDSSEINAHLDDIHGELKAIRSALESGMSRPVQVIQPAARVSGGANPALPALSDGRGEAAAAPRRSDGDAAPSVAIQPAARVSGGGRRPPVASQPAARDASGRFVAGGDRGGPDGGSGDVDRTPGAITSMGERIVGALRETSEGAEEADPAVKAFNEVAQPLSRGFGMIFGGGEDRHQERWYRRFWREMTQKRREDQAAHRQSQRTLRGIERNSGAEAGGGGLFAILLPLLAPLLAILGGIAAAVKGLASLAGITRMLGVLAAAVAGLKALIPRSVRSFFGGDRQAQPTRAGPRAGSAAGAADRRSPPAPDAAGRQPAAGGKVGALGRFARRIPLLGALLTAGAAAGEASSILGSDASRREKSQGVGRVAGGAAGTVGGMFAGAKLGAAIGALGGPIGVAIGGVVGGAAGAFFGDQAGRLVGEKVGGWVDELRSTNLSQTIIDAWYYTTDFAGALWGQAAAGASERWTAASESATQLWAQVSANAEALWVSATSVATGVWGQVLGVWTSAVEVMQKGWSTALELASKGWEALSGFAGQASDWLKEKTGVDLRKAYGEAKETAGSLIDGAKSAVSGVMDKVSDAASSAVASVKSGARAVADATGVTAVARSIRGAASHAEGKAAMRKAMAEANITDPNEQAAFMAQMDHESAGFTRLEESVKYSPKRFLEIFGKRAGISTEEEAKAILSKGPEATGEAMYGGAWGAKNLGNTQAGDGYKFRGRGYTQLTGRANYAAAGKALGIDLENNPDLAQDPEVAAKISTWYWKNRDGLSDAAKRGDVEAVTRRINGGTNGLADRRAKTARYLAEAQAGELTVPIGEEAPAAEVVASATPAAPAAVVPPGVVAAMAPSVAPAAPVASPAPAATTTPRPPSVPAPAEAPRTEMPIASSGRQGSGSAAQDVPRDLPDRRIAHIVTGSYSGMS